MSMDPEVSWGLKQTALELESIQLLLQDTIARLNLPTRLPVSTSKTETAKGVLKRKGSTVEVSVQAKMGRASFTVKNVDIPAAQLSVAIDAMSRAERSLGPDLLSLQLSMMQTRVEEVHRLLADASRALSSAPEYVHFPEKIHASSHLPEGVCMDIYAKDFELFLEIHVYQDTYRGFNALESVSIRSPDPSILSTGAKLEATMLRLAQISSNLYSLEKACS